MVVDGRTIEVIENETFGPNGGALYHHSRAAGNEPSYALRGRIVRQIHATVANLRKVQHRKGVGRVSRIDEKSCEKFLSRADRRHRQRIRASRNGRLDDTQFACGLRYRNVRPAEGPAAAKRYVHAKA